MTNHPGRMAKVIVLLSVLTGCLVVIGLFAQVDRPATEPALPTQMVLPTLTPTTLAVIEQESARPTASAASELSSTAPTAQPTEIRVAESTAAQPVPVVLQPTTVPTLELEHYSHSASHSTRI